MLALFNSESQEILWKKTLPEKEEFKIFYLLRNLLALSTQRALLVNSKGHIIYEYQFSTPSKPAQSADGILFSLTDNIFSCFSDGNEVVLYKAYSEYGKLTLPVRLEQVKVLYDQDQIFVVGLNSDELLSYAIDPVSFTFEGQHKSNKVKD